MSWQQVYALEAQAKQMRQDLLAASPCAEGWSRHDPWVNVSADDCVYTGWWVQAALAGLCCCLVVFATVVLPLVSKSLSKGQLALSNANRQIVFSALSAALACAVSLRETELKSPLSLALWCATVVFVIDGLRVFAVDVFLMSCVDTCFAMETARALRLKGYVVVFGSIAQYASTVGVLFCFGASGDLVYALLWLAAFYVCIVALYLVAANLASTAAAKVPDNDENRQLRRRLRNLRKGAMAVAAPIAFWVPGCAAIAAVPALRRQGGAFAPAVMLLGAINFLWLNVTRSRRRRRRRQQATVMPCASPDDDETRRLSDVEGAVHTAPTDASHSAVALALGVHERGVSLAFLRRFAQQKGVGQRASTAEVCEQEVKPAAVRRYTHTHAPGAEEHAAGHAAGQRMMHGDKPRRKSIAETIIAHLPGNISKRGVVPVDEHIEGAQKGCAYYTMLAHDGDAALVGRSDYFLSHSWSYRFHDLIRILENFEERLPVQSTPRYYWFDIFVMNQHSTTEIGDDLLQNLRRSIEAPGKLLLLVDSWRDPAPLARCWCLFEIYTAIQCGADIVMCLSRSEENSFMGELDSNQMELAQLVQAIDAEEAEATVESDKAMILGRISEEIGFDAFNAKLRDTLLAALQQTVMAASSPFRSAATRMTPRRMTPRKTTPRKTPQQHFRALNALNTVVER